MDTLPDKDHMEAKVHIDRRGIPLGMASRSIEWRLIFVERATEEGKEKEGERRREIKGM